MVHDELVTDRTARARMRQFQSLPARLTIFRTRLLADLLDRADDGLIAIIKSGLATSVDF